MNFFKRRQKRKEADRQYMAAARVRGEDTLADRLASGNVYSSADIEMLEREKLAYWRRRKRA